MAYLFVFSPNAGNANQNNSKYGHFSRGGTLKEKLLTLNVDNCHFQKVGALSLELFILKIFF